MSQSSGAISIDDGLAEDLLRQMLRVRMFEEEAQDRSAAGEIPGFLHLDYGHEGNHAGLGAALDDEDWLAVGGARLVGQYIAKGVPLTEIMAELYGKSGGSNRGNGGQMHVADIDRRLYGHAATIGSGQNPAVGMALAEQMKGTDNVALTTIGDGGTSRGSFHTALVFAAYWSLPVVFFIENNEWAISTSSKKLPLESLADYAEPFTTMASANIDGSDVEAVYETVSEALERARRGDGPTLVESNVARLTGHFEGDPEAYRDDAEKQDAMENRDPIENWRARVVEQGVLSEDEIATMRDEIHSEVESAVEFARESEYPATEEAYDNVLRLPLYGQEESR